MLKRLVVIRTALVPPDTNLGARFEVEFIQDVLHVFLDSARAAPENLSDLAIAFAGGDPFRDFEFAFGQGTQRLEISGSALVYFRGLAVPGGHGRLFLAEFAGLVYTHNGVCPRCRKSEVGDRGALRQSDVPIAVSARDKQNAETLKR